MKPVSWTDIEIKGEPAVRALMNYSRLEGKWYRPDEIWTADQHGWPADWEGRVMLALVLHAQTSHRHPAYIDKMIEMLPSYLNKKGYLGDITSNGACDEQQMAGHSWLLRALIEYYRWKGDERVLEIVKTMVAQLFLPAVGKYRYYPIDPATRVNSEHWQLSKLQTKTKKHADTSDCGCAFIPLDGLTYAYELLKLPELRTLIKEMIAKYREIDFVALKVQTHATLSGVRGIIKFYELTGEKEYLDLAIKMFEMYKTEAWTESYANYNWFDNPRWTELCAVVDSFMVAVNLWRHTGKPVYLEDVHHVYYNAFCHQQRENGGFGSDNCAGAQKGHEVQYCIPNNYETFWCCTMRAGEGFARVIESCYFTDGATVNVPFYCDNHATLRLESGFISLEQTARYPYEGAVRFLIKKNTAGKVNLRFFVPSWSKAGAVTLARNGKAQAVTIDNGFLSLSADFADGDIIDLDVAPYAFAQRTTMKNNIQCYHSFRFGPLILAYKTDAIFQSEDFINPIRGYEKSFTYRTPVEIPLNAKLTPLGKAKFKVEATEFVLSPLCEIKEISRENTSDQILFKT